MLDDEWFARGKSKWNRIYAENFIIEEAVPIYIYFYPEWPPWIPVVPKTSFLLSKLFTL
jgi:hypothetical protein